LEEKQIRNDQMKKNKTTDNGRQNSTQIVKD